MHSEEGIITGCDNHQEWILPWWWEHYSAHNAYPVAFADFGMSESGLTWCRERGICVTAPQLDNCDTQKIPAEKKQLWEEHYGKGIWTHRAICLRKALVFPQSPFLFSVWIDLDCRVRGSLEPLLQILRLGAHIGMRKEIENVQKTHQKKGFLQEGEINYNSGVIPFYKNAEILVHWERWIREATHEFIFDQHAFARALRLNPTVMFELPAIYNWSPWDGSNENALIYHFHGGFMKDPAFMMLFP